MSEAVVLREGRVAVIVTLSYTDLKTGQQYEGEREARPALEVSADQFPDGVVIDNVNIHLEYSANKEGK